MARCAGQPRATMAAEAKQKGGGGYPALEGAGAEDDGQSAVARRFAGPKTVLLNFVVMSVCFSVNHGTVTARPYHCCAGAVLASAAVRPQPNHRDGVCPDTTPARGAFLPRPKRGARAPPRRMIPVTDSLGLGGSLCLCAPRCGRPLPMQ